MKNMPEDVPLKPHADDHPDLASLNARSGLILFAVYSAVYAVFVGLSAFSPETMGQSTPLGPNVAILYGFGLIIGAFLLAMVYMFLCGRNANTVRRAVATPGVLREEEHS
jgi:uncharacterized membrane protein (DUF485 family)